MTAAAVASLGESITILFALGWSVFVFAEVLVRHVIGSRYRKRSPTTFVVIYVVNALGFALFGFVHSAYAILAWSPTISHYRHSIVFWTGFPAAVFLVTLQISVFHLGLERVYSLCFPMDYARPLQRSLYGTYIASQIICVSISLLVGLQGHPATGISDCSALSCLLPVHFVLLYFGFRTVCSFVNLVLGVAFTVMVIVYGLKGYRNKFSSRVAVTTFFCNFAFDCLPHTTLVLIFVMTCSWVVRWTGPYSFFFGSLDVALCAVFFRRSFAKMREAVDAKAARVQATRSGPEPQGLPSVSVTGATCSSTEEDTVDGKPIAPGTENNAGGVPSVRA